MTVHRQLLPQNERIQRVNVADYLGVGNASADVVFTREHDVIRQWADTRRAEPSTGKATHRGRKRLRQRRWGWHPVQFSRCGGVGQSVGRSGSRTSITITARSCVNNDHSMPLSNRYRIVKADEWKFPR